LVLDCRGGHTDRPRPALKAALCSAQGPSVQAGLSSVGLQGCRAAPRAAGSSFAVSTYRVLSAGKSSFPVLQKRAVNSMF